jgi:capsid portal protein
MCLRVCQRMTTLTECMTLYVYNIYTFYIDLKVLRDEEKQCLRQEKKTLTEFMLTRE